MEITLAVIGSIVSIISVIICILTLVSNRKDKAIQNTKENHQELIEYQLKEIKEDNKEMKNDLKEIRKTLSTYRDTIGSMIKVAIEEHVKMYHKKEK